MIYFVQAGPSGPIKIGFTSSWGVRLSSLQSANHEELLVKALMQGDRDDESKLHERFASSRVRGEWFEATPELKALCHEIGMAALDVALAVPGSRRTTIMLSDDAWVATKAEAAINRRPWNHELAVLIDEALAARAKKAKAA